MLKTSKWVFANWGELKELVEVFDKVVVVAVRGRPAAAVMSPTRWAATAEELGLDPENVERLPGSEARKDLSTVWRRARAGLPTMAMYYQAPTMVFAPVSVLPEDHEDLQPQAVAG